MSAFLGPIHHLMYQKIKLQNELTDTIIHQINPRILLEVNETCGTYATGNLENIIDHNQIHQWLSNEVEIAQRRLAFTVAKLLLIEKATITTISDIYYQQAKPLFSSSEINSCTTIFDSLKNLLLDGMPCDGGIDIQQQSKDEVLWEVNPIVHEPYWLAYGLNMSIAMQLRYAWLQGYISQETSFFIEQLQENVFTLRKE